MLRMFPDQASTEVTCRRQRVPRQNQFRAVGAQEQSRAVRTSGALAELTATGVFTQRGPSTSTGSQLNLTLIWHPCGCEAVTFGCWLATPCA